MMNDRAGSYPGRPPKKYIRRDLHGRVRVIRLPYRDFKRFQKFWVDLFGWDMFELPGSAGGTVTENGGSPEPTVVIATGPAYETWEGVVPGHMNAVGYKGDPSDEDSRLLMMEIHMDEPAAVTARKVIDHGGSIIGDIPEASDNWTTAMFIRDPAGNKWRLWKCPPSRTWDEAEAGCDVE